MYQIFISKENDYKNECLSNDIMFWSKLDFVAMFSLHYSFPTNSKYKQASISDTSPPIFKYFTFIL